MTLEVGAIVTSSDGSRCWQYLGDNPSLPYNWAMIVNRNPNAAPPSEAQEWNETGLRACPRCAWQPESDEQRRRREARERREGHVASKEISAAVT